MSRHNQSIENSHEIQILFFLGTIAIFATSCSSDDSGIAANDESGVTHFVETRTVLQSSGNEVQSILDYIIVNGKFGSYTIETFSGGTSLGTQSNTDFVYQGDLLASVAKFDGVRHFFYDGQGRLVGADRSFEGDAIYYKFTHQSGNVVFCERINAAYDNPNAQVMYRNILTFDANDNLTAAGPDLNLDGQADYENVFSNANGNITGAALDSGANLTFNYSPIVNNRQYFTEKSYGRQVMRLMCSEAYAGANPDHISETLFSRNLFD